ncbi:hypothetical protein GGI12_001605 [Dipsacomyces acuminosporus]|nr:hypothetical protein GGI12_001605 [Dipsacomyces acuminosporus]
MQEMRRRLPVFKHRLQILYALEKHRVLVVVGEPGSGKSTQIPQYLLESGWANGNKVIGCTQPRGVAAAMLAQRVSEEVGEDLGTKVGYAVRFSNVCSQKATRIKYLTDGTLVRECLADPLLSAYSVVMVDEAQDRSIATDTILALLKKILQKRSDFRVVVSSASMDAERYKSYFESDMSASQENENDSMATVMTIAGRQFPVDIHYRNEPCENYLAAAVETALAIHRHEAEGDILVFLPGKDDINAAMSDIDEHSDTLFPVPLYAGLSAEEQRLVFDPAPDGVRKVVISTNVAEASVTLEGVRYVVDCGFSKQRVFHPASGIDRLLTLPISKSSAKQRAGRAGRTQPGKVYRLYTHAALRSGLFPEHSTPEICRLCLAPMLLTLKALGVSNLVRFDYFQPPPPELLSHGLEMLSSLGAIDPQTGELTQPFGMHLAELPLDPALGACLLNSAQKYSCVKEAVAAVSMISAGSPFVVPSSRRAEALEDRRGFMVQEGDALTLVNALVAYKSIPARSRKQWCILHFLDAKLMDQANRISRQLESLLSRMGYRNISSSCASDFALLQKCLASGFFANAAQLAPSGAYSLLRDATTLVHIHPASVFFSGNPKPRYAVFVEAMETTKIYMKSMVAVDPKWLAEVAPHFYSAT